MKRNLLFILIVSVLLVTLVSAADFTPQGNINLRGIYNITGAPFVNATLYYGNGSQLTGVTVDVSTINHNNLTGLQGGASAEYFHINSSQYTELVSNIFNWITSWLVPDTNSNYIYNDSTTIYFNESYLNETGDSRWVNSDGDIMTGDLNFSNSGIYNVSFISLNITQSEPAHLEGLIFYDSDTLVPSFYTEDTEVKNSLGLEIWKRVRNTGGVQINNGDAVYINGSTGQVAEVGLAVSSSVSTAAVIGLATEDIAENAFGWVTVLGDVHELNTSAFSAGDVIYLSETTPGSWTNTAPSAPNFAISLGEVIMSHVNQGIISVRPSPTDVINHMVIQDLSVNNNLSVTGNTTASNFFGNISADFVKIALGSGSPTVDQLQEYFDNTGSSGFFLGGELTDGGSGTLDVAAGSGFIRTTNDDNAELQSFKWSASAGIAITDNTTQYVYVDDSGSISLSQEEFLESPDKIQIGVVTDESGGIESTFALGVRLQESIAEAGRFIRRVHGISRDTRKGGLIMGQSGDANRDVTMTAGSLWWGRTEYIISSFDTSGADTFLTYSASGQENSSASQFPNTQYDNSGTLTTISNNRWANLFFFLEPDDHIVMIYGRGQFTSEALAENEGVPSTSLPSRVSETSILISRFTFQESSNTATISSAFDTLFANAGVTDHGNLAGLSDDDHTQYLLTDGSRSLTGNLNVGGNNITNIDVGVFSDFINIVSSLIKFNNVDFLRTFEFDTSIALGFLTATSGVDSVFIGLESGEGNSGDQVTAVGFRSADGNTQDALMAIGYEAGLSNSGTFGVFMGHSAGRINSGDRSVGIGTGAGQSNNADRLTAVGYNAGQTNTGEMSSFLGYLAGLQNTGIRTTGIGAFSSNQNDGKNVTAIGYASALGNTGDDSVFIGYGAGDGNTDSNIFIVKQSTVNAIPLIFGNFLSGYIGIGTSTPQNKLNVIGDINLTGLIYGDGSQLTGISGGNSSWNETHANTLYVPYNGATEEVDLGAFNLRANQVDTDTIDSYNGNGISFDDDVKVWADVNVTGSIYGNNIGSTTAEINNVYVSTNARIYFGNGQEGSIYYNGTNLIIAG